MEKFGVDLKLLIAQLVNFVIFLYVFKKFVFKPFIQTIDAEKSKEQERERILKDLQEKEVRMKQEEEKWRLEMKKEQDNILTETKKLAEDLKTDILKQANQESAHMIERTAKQLEQERKDLYADVKSKTIEISMSIVTNALHDYLTEDTRKRLTEYIIKNMSDKANFE